MVINRGEQDPGAGGKFLKRCEVGKSGISIGLGGKVRIMLKVCNDLDGVAEIGFHSFLLFFSRPLVRISTNENRRTRNVHVKPTFWRWCKKMRCTMRK